MHIGYYRVGRLDALVTMNEYVYWEPEVGRGAGRDGVTDSS